MGYATAVDRRLRRLEAQQARKAALEPDTISWQLQVTASCPPDKRVHIRSGIGVPAYQWGAVMQADFVPDQIGDFENSTETQMDLMFSNAGYYLPIVLCYYGDWVCYHSLGGGYLEPVFDNVIGAEVETAAEAEVQIDGFLNGVGQWYNYRVPLSGLVFKNDGRIDTQYAILPIDVVNRGRSYLYRDARVRRGAMP